MTEPKRTEELIARLKDRERFILEGPASTVRLGLQAAEMLSSLQAEKEAMRAALEPFAKMRPPKGNYSGSTYTITRDQIDAARAALEGK